VLSRDVAFGGAPLRPLAPPHLAVFRLRSVGRLRGAPEAAAAGAWRLTHSTPMAARTAAQTDIAASAATAVADVSPPAPAAALALAACAPSSDAVAAASVRAAA
jgi:hypothetical protein